MGLFDLLSSTIAIDTGSANTRILKGEKIIFDESTVLSIDPTNQNRITGVGKEINAESPNILIEPFRYVINDFKWFESYLRSALNRIDHSIGSVLPKTYDMYFSIPIGITEAEKRAVRDAGEHAGARSIRMIFNPVCAALGLGILFHKQNFTLVDFSTSKFEITIFADSIPVKTTTLRLGTKKIESLVKNHVIRKHGISPTIAELRQLINGCFSNLKQDTIQHIEIAYVEIEKLVESYLGFAIDEFSTYLESVDQNERKRILASELYFTGGGTFYSNLCNAASEQLGFKAKLSQKPLTDGINGLKEILKNPKRFESYWMT